MLILLDWLKKLNSILSNTTKPIFLNSIFQEVTNWAVYVCTTLRRHRSEDSELFLAALHPHFNKIFRFVVDAFPDNNVQI